MCTAGSFRSQVTWRSTSGLSVVRFVPEKVASNVRVRVPSLTNPLAVAVKGVGGLARRPGRGDRRRLEQRARRRRHRGGRAGRRADRREARERGRGDDARDALQIGAELLGTGEVRLRAGAVAAGSDDEYGGGRET